jgi:recombination protein RecT
MTTTTNGATAQQNGNGQVMVQEKSIADNMMARIKAFEETGTIHVPKNYSAPNALRAAYLILLDTKTMDKRPVLEVCTRESIANALLRMVIQGLNPVKRQCSFIAYGNQLTMQREYQGSIAIAKRDAGLVKVHGNAIYKNDEFAWEIDPETLKKKITKHVQTLDSLSGEVIGAYAVKEYTDGKREAEIMPMNQIRAAWRQGPTKGESPAHKNFPDQMAIKTVINRALKIDINSSDDSALMDDDSENLVDDVRTAGVKLQIEEKANKTELSIDAGEQLSEAAEKNVDQTTGEVKEQVNEPATATPGF